MSLNIRLKHTSQANKKPQPADLKSGELAININNASPAGYALDDVGAVQQMFGKATETQEGQAEIATQGEVDTGTDDERIVTPAKLGQRIADYTANTVTPAIAVETAARTAADAAEIAARTAADTAEATARANGDNLRVLKTGDTMTGNLTVPLIEEAKNVAVGIAKCGNAGITEADLLAATFPENLIKEVQKGSKNLFRIQLKTPKAFDQLVITATISTTSDNLGFATVSLDKATGATDGFTPHGSFVIRTVQVAPTSLTMTEDFLGLAITIFEVNQNTNKPGMGS